MSRYVIRRLLQAIPTLIGISLISFFLSKATPGDPIRGLTDDPKITQATRETLRKQLGLDQPLVVQYVRWVTGLVLRPGNAAAELTLDNTPCTYLSFINFTVCDSGGGIIRGDLGISIATKQPVWQRIIERLPATLELTTTGLVVGLLLGIPLGVLSAVRHGSSFDNAVRFLAVIGNAVPVFWMGLILIFVFGVYLNWLPTGGRQTVSLNSEFDLLDRLRHLFLPALVLAVGDIAVLSRFMRAETLEVLHTDYIRTAKAKGLVPRQVWFVHATRNALIPLVTILGPAIAGLIGGALVTETIF
ncbi:MAG: ABC transporter permease, partial [Chloroflexi bacterium]|nr:ABC transporter permease [Chloroflexota bacterium]